MSDITPAPRDSPRPEHITEIINGHRVTWVKFPESVGHEYWHAQVDERPNAKGCWVFNKKSWHTRVTFDEWMQAVREDVESWGRGGFAESTVTG